MDWRKWTPQDFEDNTKIREIWESLPQTPIKIPKIIEAIENPFSFLRLNGSADIVSHDIVHILLGRGLLPQDEAFVIGFTMGNHVEADAYDRLLFRKISRHFYRPPFNFTRENLDVYDLAFDLGANHHPKNIGSEETKRYMDYTLIEARSEYQLNKEILRDWRDKEVCIVGETKVSMRLTYN